MGNSSSGMAQFRSKIEIDGEKIRSHEEPEKSISCMQAWRVKWQPSKGQKLLSEKRACAKQGPAASPDGKQASNTSASMDNTKRCASEPLACYDELSTAQDGSISRGAAKTQYTAAGGQLKPETSGPPSSDTSGSGFVLYRKTRTEVWDLGKARGGEAKGHPIQGSSGAKGSNNKHTYLVVKRQTFQLYSPDGQLVQESSGTFEKQDPPESFKSRAPTVLINKLRTAAQAPPVSSKRKSKTSNGVNVLSRYSDTKTYQGVNHAGSSATCSKRPQQQDLEVQAELGYARKEPRPDSKPLSMSVPPEPTPASQGGPQANFLYLV